MTPEIIYGIFLGAIGMMATWLILTIIQVVRTFYATDDSRDTEDHS